MSKHMFGDFDPTNYKARDDFEKEIVSMITNLKRRLDAAINDIERNYLDGCLNTCSKILWIYREKYAKKT